MNLDEMLKEAKKYCIHPEQLAVHESIVRKYAYCVNYHCLEKQKCPQRMIFVKEGHKFVHVVAEQEKGDLKIYGPKI